MSTKLPIDRDAIKKYLAQFPVTTNRSKEEIADLVSNNLNGFNDLDADTVRRQIAQIVQVYRTYQPDSLDPTIILKEVVRFCIDGKTLEVKRAIIEGFSIGPEGLN